MHKLKVEYGRHSTTVSELIPVIDFSLETMSSLNLFHLAKNNRRRAS